MGCTVDQLNIEGQLKSCSLKANHAMDSNLGPDWQPVGQNVVCGESKSMLIIAKVIFVFRHVASAGFLHLDLIRKPSAISTSWHLSASFFLLCLPDRRQREPRRRRRWSGGETWPRFAISTSGRSSRPQTLATRFYFPIFHSFMSLQQRQHGHENL